MTLLEKINSLTWYDLINKLKDILKGLAGQGGGDSRPYKVYTALLSQSGTDAPVATVLENTLGDIVWSYVVPGIYTGTLFDTFLENKTIGFSGNGRFSIGEPTSQIEFYRNNNNSIGIEIPGGTDDLITGFPIEIRVYN